MVPKKSGQRGARGHPTALHCPIDMVSCLPDPFTYSFFFFLVGEAGGGGGKKLSIFFCYESLILTVRVLKIETISVIYLTNPYSILEATREFHNEQI